MKIKAIITSIIMMATSMAAMAQAGLTKDNPLELEAGKTYKIDSKYSFKAIYAIFKATEDGVMTMTNVGADQLDLFTDNTYSEMAPTQPEWNGSYNPKEYALKVKAGETYYLGCGFVMNTGTIAISFGVQATPIEMVKMSPADGSVLKVGSDVLSFEFNKNVAYSKITVTVAGATTQELGGYASGCYLTVEIKEPLMTMYKAGTMKKGDKVVFAIEGLCDARNNSNVYGSDGKLTVSYTAAEKPLELTAANNVPQGTPNSMTTFSSWYMPDDESGVVTLAFDGEISMDGDNMPKATLTYGDLEMENGLYMEQLEVKALDSKTIAVDLRNKLRRHKDMLTIDETYNEMTLSISNVHGKDGQFSYSQGSSAIGSYTYVYNYSEVRYSVMSDYAPYTSASRPTSIDNLESIEIWLSEEGTKKMSYSGIWFITDHEGEKDTVLVEKKDLKIEADAYDANAQVITVGIPQLKADENSNVVVTFADVVSPDGVDHSALYTAVYTTAGTNSISRPTANGQQPTAVYTIDGKRLNAPLHKGVYIVGGKKAVMKDER